MVDFRKILHISGGMRTVENLKPQINYADLNLKCQLRSYNSVQIFICGKFIGGFSELSQLHEAKQLMEKVLDFF